MQLLQTTDNDFSSKFKALVDDRREVTVDVSATVRAILADVKERGDVAVLDYTSRFDHFNPQFLHLSETFIAEHAAQCPSDVVAAARTCARANCSFPSKATTAKY
ncbi:histidinol dehydrogenase [Calothrix sp. NIES-4071]|nr:histidinol dehydrogenase [Calothrix sp. NIES-4071]BAZ55244.1 histidinol dehydrogenase [Calothrix sp. NIES-4105]